MLRTMITLELYFYLYWVCPYNLSLLDMHFMIQFQLSITVCTHVYIASATNMQAMQLPLVICQADRVLLQDGRGSQKKLSQWLW
jgi:hypothetical protein